MEVLKKQFDPEKGFIFLPEKKIQLGNLICELTGDRAFVIYHGENVDDLEGHTPIIGHAGICQGKLLAPILSSGEINGDGVYMLDPDVTSKKIIRVPTGIPLEGMRDAYRYICAINVYFVQAQVQDILSELRQEGWEDYNYTRQDCGPIDFVTIETLRRSIQRQCEVIV